MMTWASDCSINEIERSGINNKTPNDNSKCHETTLSLNIYFNKLSVESIVE